MKKYSHIVILGIVALIFVISNPDKEDHISKIKEDMLSRMDTDGELQGSLDVEDPLSAAGAVLGYSLGSFLTDKFLKTMVTVDNYLLFSVSKLRFAGKTRTMAVGLLGNIFIF